MPKFRKKPVVVEARQLDISHFGQYLSLYYWTRNEREPLRILRTDEIERFEKLRDEHQGLPIETLEGTMIAKDSDWIIKGVNDEFYPCKPDIFEKTYEEIDKCSQK